MEVLENARASKQVCLPLTFLWRVNNFCTIRSGIDAAGDGRGWRVEELLLHVGLFDKCTRGPQQHDTVQHLQSDHPAHKHTKI